MNKNKRSFGPIAPPKSNRLVAVTLDVVVVPAAAAAAARSFDNGGKGEIASMWKILGKCGKIDHGNHNGRDEEEQHPLWRRSILVVTVTRGHGALYLRLFFFSNYRKHEAFKTHTRSAR